MPRLSNNQKCVIVTALARFRSPSEVVDLVKQEFGIDVSRQQVDYYNPRTASSSDHLADRWRQLFREQRSRYLGSVQQVAIAHERYRLEQLQKILHERMKAGDHVTALKVLKQAAKERGRQYTNVRDIQSDGDKVDTPTIYVFGDGSNPQEAVDEDSPSST